MLGIGGMDEEGESSAGPQPQRQGHILGSVGLVWALSGVSISCKRVGDDLMVAQGA